MKKLLLVNAKIVNEGKIFEGDLPQEAHDQKVNAVVTPTKIIRFS